MQGYDGSMGFIDEEEMMRHWADVHIEKTVDILREKVATLEEKVAVLEEKLEPSGPSLGAAFVRVKSERDELARRLDELQERFDAMSRGDEDDDEEI